MLTAKQAREISEANSANHISTATKMMRIILDEVERVSKLGFIACVIPNAWLEMIDPNGFNPYQEEVLYRLRELEYKVAFTNELFVQWGDA